MVEYTLDNIFQSLADPTRRDILRRVCQTELSISQLAIDYDMSFSAVAKHLKILEHARLIIKRRRGKQQLVTANPESISEAVEHLEEYKRFMNERYDVLDELLRKE